MEKYREGLSYVLKLYGVCDRLLKDRWDDSGAELK